MHSSSSVSLALPESGAALTDRVRRPLHRAPEKVFGLMDMHENLDALLPTLTDMIDGDISKSRCSHSPDLAGRAANVATALMHLVLTRCDLLQDHSALPNIAVPYALPPQDLYMRECTPQQNAVLSLDNHAQAPSAAGCLEITGR